MIFVIGVAMYAGYFVLLATTGSMLQGISPSLAVVIFALLAALGAMAIGWAQTAIERFYINRHVVRRGEESSWRHLS